jgi:outer membrane protein TolC
MTLRWLGMLIILAGTAMGAEPFGLESYLSQVKKQHLGYQGSVLASEGAKARAQEGETLLAFTLFANGQYVIDRSPKIAVIQGTKNEFQSYSLGVSKLTTFGLAGKLYYNLNHTLISGLTPLPLPGFTIPSNYYDARPALELTYSVLRNGSGRETRAAIEAIEAAAMSQSHAESYRAQLIEAEAEIAYWRLSLAREAIQVQIESVDRAKRILAWNDRRVKLRLADESDRLQAESGLKLRQLELQSVADEERTAALNFNSLRGIDKPVVEETLVSIHSVNSAKLDPPKRSEKREDVQAALDQSRAAQASALMSIEKNMPNLELYSMLSLNGRDPKLGDAMAYSFHDAQPVFAAGLRFSVPLDLDGMAESRRGYDQEARGADLKYQRKLFEQDKEWNDLNQRYGELKRRLDLAKQIEAVQEDKFAHEKERQTVGRSTTFFVLQFEQDLATSQFKRLSLEAELLTLVAQMKTFGPSSLAGGVQ